MTPAAVICAGLDLPLVDTTAVPPGTTCALYGHPIDEGVRTLDIIRPSQMEIMELFDRVDGWVSAEVATVYRAYSPKANASHRSMLWVDGLGFWQPRATADGEGDQWSDLARLIWPAGAGCECLVLYLDDFKKRVWPHARMGVLGSVTWACARDTRLDLYGPLTLDWPRLVRCLDLIEPLLSSGVSKSAIERCVIGAKGIGLRASIAAERDLAAERGHVEFGLAVRWARKRSKQSV